MQALHWTWLTALLTIGGGLVATFINLDIWRVNRNRWRLRKAGKITT